MNASLVYKTKKLFYSKIITNGDVEPEYQPRESCQFRRDCKGYGLVSYLTK